MKIYTKTGDYGETGLVGGARVSKSHICMDAIGNVDVTLIAQKPKVNVETAEGDLVKELMRANLGRLLHTPVDRLNVKARTHEKVDSVGECRAIECHVVMILELDPSAPPAATSPATSRRCPRAAPKVPR